MDFEIGNIVRHKRTGEDRNTGLPTKFCRTKEEFEQEFEIVLPNIKVTKGLL